jgi:hypothetical protein
MSALFTPGEVEVRRVGGERQGGSPSGGLLYALGVHVGWLDEGTNGMGMARHVRARGDDPEALAVLRAWLPLYVRRLEDAAERAVQEARDRIAAREAKEVQDMRDALREARRAGTPSPG